MLLYQYKPKTVYHSLFKKSNIAIAFQSFVFRILEMTMWGTQTLAKKAVFTLVKKEMASYCTQGII